MFRSRGLQIGGVPDQDDLRVSDHRVLAGLRPKLSERLGHLRGPLRGVSGLVRFHFPRRHFRKEAGTLEHFVTLRGVRGLDLFLQLDLFEDPGLCTDLGQLPDGRLDSFHADQRTDHRQSPPLR